MKQFNTLLAGSAAGLLSVVAAQAADLPSRKSAPVEYVRVCDAYGAGFYWIPGTETCLKIGGRVRIDTWYTPAKNAVRLRSAGAAALPTFHSANGVDTSGWYARALLMMDARTQSAWGTVQTVLTMRFANNTGLAVTSPFAGYAAGSFAGGNAATNVAIEAAYIRFAGFTIGQAASNYTFLQPFQIHSMWAPGFPNGIRQFAYTATFGGGFSATVAIENRGDLSAATTANALGINPFSAVASTATAAGPQRLPALVANLRVDQAWGSAMLSGVVLQNTANFATPAGLAVVNNVGPLMKKTGWAIGGGIRINLPMLARGDSVQVWATYGVGALGYSAMSGLNANTAVTANYVGGFLRADRDLTIFCANAACTAGGVEQARAFSVAGLFTHYWSPSLRSNLIGSYIRLTPGNVTRNTDWTQGGLSEATAWSVQGNLIWSPIRNFDIGVELAYARLTQSLANQAGFLPTAIPCAPAAPHCLASVSSSNWTGRMRVERTF